MNCPKCQALVPTGATVCPTCGEALPASQPAKKKLPIPLIAGGAGALVVIIILIVALAGSGAKGLVSNTLKAYEKEDGKYIYKTVPQLSLDAMNETLFKDDQKDEDAWIQYFDNIIDEEVKDREDDYETDAEVVKARKVKKDIVEQFNEYLDKESMYKDVYNEKDHKVTAAYILEIRTEEIEDGEYSYDYEEIIAIKEDGKWKNASYLDIVFDWENGIDEDEDKED